MYLARLEIRNFRAIEHMVVDFRREDTRRGVRRWTVLLGENGSGKSTILKAIGLLLAGSEALADLVGRPEHWIHNGARRAELRASLLTASGEQREVSLVLRRGEGRDAIIRNNENGLAPLDQAIRHARSNCFIAGYGAFRRPPDTHWQGCHHSAQHSEVSRAARLGTLFCPSQSLISLEGWALDLDYVKGTRGRELIATALASLLPGVRFRDIDKEARSVVMSTVDGDVPLRHLSEGYQAMAAWAGDLLFRMTEAFEGRAKPLSARGILLIDEMDMHLHPVWKRQLVEYLDATFPNLQVIATTHSPLAIQQCGEGEVFAMRRPAAARPPELVPFRGDPAKMRLSELFLSPVVGLETLDSPGVAALREEARGIELRPGARTPAELKRLEQIRKQLVGTTALAPAEAPAFADAMKLQASLSDTGLSERIRESEALFRAPRRASKKKAAGTD